MRSATLKLYDRYAKYLEEHAGKKPRLLLVSANTLNDYDWELDVEEPLRREGFVAYAFRGVPVLLHGAVPDFQIWAVE